MRIEMNDLWKYGRYRHYFDFDRGDWYYRNGGGDNMRQRWSATAYAIGWIGGE